MLDRRLGPGIGSIEGRKGSQKRCDECADFVVVVQMRARRLEEEEGGFGIDRAHLVKFSLADLGDRLLEYLADGVDGDVRPPDRGGRIGEQLLDSARSGQIGLEGDRFSACGLDRGDGRVGVGLRRSAVVVDGDSLCPMLGEVAGDEPTQILRAADNDDGFPRML